jgi:hypothetical protein
MKHGTYYVLNATRHLIDPVCSNGCICRLVESDILVFLISPFINIPNEFVRLEGGSIDKALIPVPDLIELVIKAIRFTLSYQMIDHLPVQVFKGIVEYGFPCPYINISQCIKYPEGNDFACLE